MDIIKLNMSDFNTLGRIFEVVRKNDRVEVDMNDLLPGDLIIDELNGLDGDQRYASPYGMILSIVRDESVTVLWTNDEVVS